MALGFLHTSRHNRDQFKAIISSGNFRALAVSPARSGGFQQVVNGNTVSRALFRLGLLPPAWLYSGRILCIHGFWNKEPSMAQHNPLYALLSATRSRAPIETQARRIPERAAPALLVATIPC